MKFARSPACGDEREEYADIQEVEKVPSYATGKALHMSQGKHDADEEKTFKHCNNCNKNHHTD